MSTRVVSVVSADGGYPLEAPFHPDEAFPEYGNRPVSGSPNHAYRAVRAALAALGLDASHFGSPRWNPLGELVRPGDRVFIKPNLVADGLRGACRQCNNLFAIITHPSVVRAVADYAAIALRGSGEILIGDNPSIDCVFPRLLQATRLDSLPAVYREHFGVSSRVLDLRPIVCPDLRVYGIASKMIPGPGDPRGVRVVELGDDSFFAGMSPALFRGVFTDRTATRHAHTRGHRYVFSGSILDADVYVSVPKLKTHHKVGATLNVKGLVGTVADKNGLPHWRIGFPGAGGDEFPPLPIKDKLLVALRHACTESLPEGVFHRIKAMTAGSPFEILLHETALTSGHFARGAWPGNDTCWRMAADLYLAFVQRRIGTTRFLSVIDGIVAGEGDGPFCPTPRDARVILAGDDLLATDLVAVRLMGLDREQVRYLPALVARTGLQESDILVLRDGQPDEGFFAKKDSYLTMKPPRAWPKLALAATRAPWRSRDGAS
jgi:uncharacterized protein (DUF362 family)